MNILIRADSSYTIGTGHIMRDLVLAREFYDARITFATQNLAGNINDKIDKLGYGLKILHSNDAQELDALIKKLNTDMLIIDHYDINAAFEKQIKVQNPALKIMVLDDTYKKHHCDILLNHNIYADARKYKELVPKQCDIRCGKKYTLLREEFTKAKKQLKKSSHRRRSLVSKNKKILIAMGGSDTKNLNIKIMKTIKRFRNIKVDIVTTKANKNLKALQKYTKKKAWASLHIDTDQIAELASKSDFAIITPSSIANELYFMKIPFIAIKTADNQDYMYRFLKKKNYKVLRKFSNKRLRSAIAESL